jgi:Uma2 family endonuclease
VATPVQADIFDHDGPWSEEDFLALSEDPRIELLDGELLVSPSARHAHQRMSSRLWGALAAAAPEAFEVLEAVNVRVAPGRILIPDLVIITNPGADVTVSEASDVALVLEIVSPGSVAVDRAVKPQLYAAAGIDGYVRVELGPGDAAAVQYRLGPDGYREVRRGGRMLLTVPFHCNIDLAKIPAPRPAASD